MGIKRIDEKLCTGCGICLEDCPMDVIRMNEETDKAYIRYPGDCQSCHLCEMACPENAIDLSPEYTKRLCFPY